MGSNGQVKKLKKVESILISQPKPTRSPYFDLAKKYGIKIDFRQFIHVEPVELKEFRKSKIQPEEYSAIIFTSRQSINHFFRLTNAMRIKMSQDTRYFCMSKAIADYLQKFIVYRKRKVFYGKRKIEDLEPSLMKYKETERFLMPCSNLGKKDVSNFLTEKGFNWQEAMMYKTLCSDLSDLSDVTYDVLVFFSPLGIDSLYENFPDFKQNETRIAVFGNSTKKAVLDRNLTVNIAAPMPDVPSMTMALENYLLDSNKDD